MSETALLLPGQGSHYVGMGKDLARRYEVVRDLYARADEAIGTPLSRLSWDGPEDELTATENAQPAILLHSYAIWSLVSEALGSVVVAAGHSLGEFSAHLIAGTFSLEDALRLVRRRGQLMANSGAARPGTMAAVVGLDREAMEAVCASVGEGTVVAANLNAPTQIVISGDVAAVRLAGDAAAEVGAKRVIPLNVSGAFHSPLMGEVAEGLDTALEEAGLAPPNFPVVANATAEPVTTVVDVRRALLSQLTSPVRWVECVERMKTFGPTRWVELGPGSVLSGLVRRIDREIRPTAIGDVEAVETMLAGNPADAG